MEPGVVLAPKPEGPAYRTAGHFVKNTARVEGSQNSNISALFITAYLALLHDSPLGDQKPSRTYTRFEKTLIGGLRPLIVAYASYADRILASCERSADGPRTGVFVDEMRGTPVFREYLHFFRTGCSHTLTYLLSFLYFGKKLDYVNPELTSEAFRKWRETEKSMDGLLIDNVIKARLRDIMSVILPDFDDTVLLPRFGSGSTAEKTLDPQLKFEQLRWDRKLAYLFRPNLFGKVDNRLEDHPSKWVDGATMRGRIKDVPKDIRSARTIALEPNAYMYAQQAVLRMFVQSIRAGLMGRFVDLSKQELSRYYAEWGSVYGQVDTIDLSEASDRVHIDIVKGIFSPKQLTYLLGTRSSTVTIPALGKKGTEIVTLNKFAPMGSALCFPTQCATFLAITILGYLMHANQIPIGGDLSCLSIDKTSLAEMLKRMNLDPQKPSSGYVAPRIYGDDICCDSNVTPFVTYLLEQCGLVVNRRKSFVGKQAVRESCGIYCFNGYTVTPMLFRVRRHKTTLDAQAFASLISQINLAGNNRLMSVRKVLIQYLLNDVKVAGVRDGTKRFAMPFVGDPDEFGIFTSRVHLKNVNVKWNNNLHREEIQRLGLCGVSDLQLPYWVYYDHYRYDQWMRAAHGGSSDDVKPSSPYVRPSFTRVRVGWTPLWQ